MFEAADAVRLATRGPSPLVPGVVAVEHEGAGWDHVAWRVTAADGTAWIVRAASLLDPGDDDVGDAVLEVAVMQLARTVLGDLVADAVVLDASLGAIAHPRVPGVALQELVAAGAVPPAVLAGLAGEIGGFVGALGALDPRRVGTPVPVDGDGFAPWYDELGTWRDEVADLLGPSELAAVSRFMARPAPPDPSPHDLVLAHGDLGAEHVLVDPATWRVTGIIDWSDAAVADPAAEAGRLLRDLGPDRLATVLDGMGVTDALRPGVTERAWAYARCLALEDLAYARRRRPHLVPAELAGLRRLFAADADT